MDSLYSVALIFFKGVKKMKNKNIEYVEILKVMSSVSFPYIQTHNCIFAKHHDLRIYFICKFIVCKLYYVSVSVLCTPFCSLNSDKEILCEHKLTT